MDIFKPLVLQLLSCSLFLGNLSCKHEFSKHWLIEPPPNPKQSPSVLPETSACLSDNTLFMSSCQSNSKKSFHCFPPFPPPPVFCVSVSNPDSHEGKPAAFSINTNLFLDDMASNIQHHPATFLTHQEKYYSILLSVEITSLLMSAGDTELHCPFLNFQTNTSCGFIGYPSHWDASQK